MNRKFIAILLCTLITLSGCNRLDFDESDGKTKEDTYSYFDYLTQLVTQIYTGLPSDFGNIGGALRESATDNAVYTWSNNAVYDMYFNQWSSKNLIDDVWAINYSYIRSANSYLENNSIQTLERFQWDPTYKDNMLPSAKMYVYEVRFLRAFYFFELAKRYGDIPLLTRTYAVDEINKIQKSNFDHVVDYIVNECDSVIPNLPVTHKANVPGGFLGGTGRATKGAAMALKARALLYAASKLHNPNNDKTKWEKAAKASWDIIASNTYSLEDIKTDPLYNINGGNLILNSKQLILEGRNGDSNTYEARNFPYGFVGATGGNTPTQNLADIYEMADGTPFSWDNPTHVNNIYYDANGNKTRDPRFYKNIMPNGTNFKGIVVETYEGGKNASPIVGATLTGYYLRKYLNESVSLATGAPVLKPHHFIIFRYAEVLLNYAEAMNELFGPDESGSYTMTARGALDELRWVVNMSSVQAPAGEQFTNYIRDERRRELAFEDHRFWDIRRWKIGEVVKDIYGVKITKLSNNLTYQKVLIQNRTWNNKMYLYPIPQSEVYINGNLTQNLGWDSE